MARRLLLAVLLITPLAAGQDEPKPATLAEIRVQLAPTEDPVQAMPFGPQRRNLRGLIQAIERAKTDTRVEGVVLELDGLGVGTARLLELRDALAELRAAGKKVFVHMESLDESSMVLASVADRLSIPESGAVFLPGVALEQWYMRELFAKLHIRFDVLAIGEYKTAGESLVRDSMSDEQREALMPILDETYASIVSAISAGRGLPEEKVVEAIDRGIWTAREAKEMGLIDFVEYEDAFKTGVKEFWDGRGVEILRNYPDGKKGTEIDPNNPMAALTMVFGAMFGGSAQQAPEGPKVAVVYCTGTIVSGESQYGWDGEIAAMGSETIVEAIDAAAKDDEVKAIVLRINSPGGSGLASDMIWRAVARAKEKKPVVASMGDVAASGGYYIAMNSSEIFALPQTITGSIGVVGLVPDISGLYKWAGIHPQRLSRGKHAETWLTSKPLDAEGKEILTTYMKSFYADFVGKVAAGRGRTWDEIDAIARGRIWTGRKAKEIGLVDQLGGLEDAVERARRLGGIADGTAYHVVESPRGPGPFQMLEGMLGLRASLGIEAAALKELPQLRRALQRIQLLRLAAADGPCTLAVELY